MQRCFVGFLIWFSCASITAWAQDYRLLQTISPDLSDGGTQTDVWGVQFGDSLAASGSYLLIGKPGFVHSDQVMRGAAEVYYQGSDGWQWLRNHWETLQSFENARCGYAVDLTATPAGNYRARIGCPFSDFSAPDGGFVRIIAGNMNGFGSGLLPGGGSSAHFGTAIDAAQLSDGTPLEVIGAPGENFVEIRASGLGSSPYDAILTGTGPANEAFGYSVSIAAGGPQCCPVWLAVGAPGWDMGRGKVYVYYYHHLDEQWKLADELFAPVSSAPADNFGASVLYYPGDNQLNPTDDWLAIGAPARRTDGSTSGAVATRGTVSVFRHGLQVGAFQHEDDVSFSHSVCVYEGRPEVCEDINQHMNFGHSLAVDKSGDLWIGAPAFDQGASPEVGRVYQARWGMATPTLPIEDWWVRSMLSPGLLSDDCGFFGTGRSGGRFGSALAALDGKNIAIAVGYPRRGCQALTIPPLPPGPRTGQVRIYGIPGVIFADRFESQ